MKAKTNFKIFCVIICGNLLLMQCNKSDNSPSPSTGSTPSVIDSPHSLTLNTISANIGGTMRVFTASSGSFTNYPLYKGSKLGLLIKEQYTKQSLLEIRSYTGEPTFSNTVSGISLILMPTDGNPGKFDITPKTGSIVSSSYIGYIEQVNGKTTGSYYPSSGTIEITSYSNKIVEGKFSATLVTYISGTGTIDTSKKPIEIKDGFFRGEVDDLR